MKKRVAVVVPNWNGQDYLADCLDSLQKQTADLKVIVVDNGSEDDSKKIIEKHKVKGIYLDKNYGFAGGVNRGIELARKENFEYVFLFNNDALLEPNAIEIMLKTAESDDKIGIVTGKFLTMDGKKLDSTGEFYSTWGLPYPRGRGSKNIDEYDDQTEIFGATGGATLFKTKLFDDIGVFDEDFFAYFEDVDISFRAQLRGWRVIYEPKAVMYHHIGATSKKIKGFATYHSFKNLPWLLIKNVPDEMMWTVVPRFIFARFFFFGSSLFRGDLGSAVSGDWQATKQIKKKWQQRKEIQASATVSKNDIAVKMYGGIPPNYLKLRSIRDFFKGKSSNSGLNSKPIIGIDLRALDGASRFRGIGQYLHNLLSLLLPKLYENYSVNLYIHDPDNLEGIDEEARSKAKVVKVPNPVSSRLHSKIINKLKGLTPNSRKSNRIPGVKDVDLFLQTYIENGIPTKGEPKTMAIAYDLIPLLFSEHYFGVGELGRHPKAWVFRATRALEKINYEKSLKGYGDADEVISISKHTKKTLVDELGINSKDVAVSYPGVPKPEKAKSDGFEPPKDPYIVYIGGIDYRRDLVTLIDAFEILREKENYKLVLAGRDFDDIHDKRLVARLENAKFKDDIIIHGFISEYAKHALMQNAIALVYPTLYEGFGIPVVEAFQDECPVITYKNSSVVEAGGDAAIYAETPELIAKNVDKLKHDQKFRNGVIEKGIEHYKQFTWEQASDDFKNIIDKMINNEL